MIRINIEADTAQQAREQMRELLGMDRETAAPAQDDTPRDPAQPVDKPKATRTKKTETPAASAEGNAASPATTADASADAAPSPTATTAPPTLDELRAKCSAYGQKGGVEALKQVFIEMGAPNGKFSEVPTDKHFALAVRLDDLIG